jgi:N-acetylglucosamine-6-phosphate deacetylase
MVARLRRVKERRPGGAAFLGIHLEGPYINPAKRGGQPLEPIRLPSIPEMDQLIEASGHNIRLVTLAPELPGALDLIRFLTSQGIVSSAGHSEATYVQMVMAVEAGLTRATHLYNGMPSLGHRNPGIVGAVLTLDAIYAELILDGVHIDPVAAQVALRAKGIDRIVLVTDATQAVGMDAGAYVRPGNRKIIVRDDAAWLESGSLAGSVLTMNRAVANATRFLHLPLADALALASRVAAQSLGAGATKGVLAPGMDADLVLLGEDMDIRMTMIAGKVVYRSSSSKMDMVKWSI